MSQLHQIAAQSLASEYRKLDEREEELKLTLQMVRAAKESIAKVIFQPAGQEAGAANAVTTNSTNGTRPERSDAP